MTDTDNKKKLETFFLSIGKKANQGVHVIFVTTGLHALTLLAVDTPPYEQVGGYLDHMVLFGYLYGAALIAWGLTEKLRDKTRKHR
jgi:hypothetical protein